MAGTEAGVGTLEVEMILAVGISKGFYPYGTLWEEKGKRM